MVYISDRQKQLLATIMSNSEGVSIKELQQSLGVSRRTIYREFEDIKPLLAKRGVAIIADRKQYNLEGNNQELAKLRQLTKEVDSKLPMSVEQRESAETCLLLVKNEPQKIIELALDLNVSEATIKNDLKHVAKSLEQYQVEFNGRKGIGIQVECDEIKRRQLIIGILLTRINDYEFFRYLEETDKKSNNFFLQLLPKSIMLMIKKTLEKTIFKQIHLDSDHSMMELILTFSLTFMRCANGNKIVDLNANSNSLKYQGYLFQFLSEYAQTEKLPVGQGDINYLANKLMASDIKRPMLSYDSDYELELSLKVKDLVQDVAHEINFDFQKNTAFINRLTKHVISLLGHHITPLPNSKIDSLTELSHRFPKLYKAIGDNWTNRFPEMSLTTSELQLLLLYFANEYTNQRYHEHIDALVICENGIGTSVILAQRLKQVFSEIKDVKISRIYELKELDLANYDLIVSTLPLSGFPGDYQLVSPLLLPDEIERIKVCLDKLQVKPNVESKDEQAVNHLGTKALSEIAIGSLFCSELVNGITVKTIPTTDLELSAIVNQCLQRLDSTLIANRAEVTEKLLKRIELAPVGLPNSNMALLHTSTHAVKRCSFTIFDLEKPIELEAMDHNLIQVTRILLMLGPAHLSTSEQAVMSMISSMIVMNDYNLSLFGSGSQKTIKDLIAKQYLDDLRQKISS